jgi:hypothetical protein
MAEKLPGVALWQLPAGGDLGAAATAARYTRGTAALHGPKFWMRQFEHSAPAIDAGGGKPLACDAVHCDPGTIAEMKN